MAEENKEKKGADEKTEGPSKLLREAMGKYGIADKHVLSSRDYGDHVVIVTKGGRKVSFAPGDKVRELTDIELTGNPPPKPKAE